MIPESSPDSSNPDLHSPEIILDMDILESYSDLDSPEIMSNMANLEDLTGLDLP